MSQACDVKEYQENVSFVEFFKAKHFEAMDALTKNSVAIIQKAEDDSNHNWYISTFKSNFFQLF